MEVELHCIRPYFALDGWYEAIVSQECEPYMVIQINFRNVWEMLEEVGYKLGD